MTVLEEPNVKPSRMRHLQSRHTAAVQAYRVGRAKSQILKRPTHDPTLLSDVWQPIPRAESQHAKRRRQRLESLEMRMANLTLRQHEGRQIDYEDALTMELRALTLSADKSVDDLERRIFEYFQALDEVTVHEKQSPV